LFSSVDRLIVCLVPSLPTLFLSLLSPPSSLLPEHFQHGIPMGRPLFPSRLLFFTAEPVSRLASDIGDRPPPFPMPLSVFPFNDLPWGKPPNTSTRARRAAPPAALPLLSPSLLSLIFCCRVLTDFYFVSFRSTTGVDSSPFFAGKIFFLLPFASFFVVRFCSSFFVCAMAGDPRRLKK